MSRGALAVGVLLLQVGCASTPRQAAAQISAGFWDADERVLITDFQRVTALARSPDQLFAATDGGLVVRSDAFERWELPVTREDGYPEAQVLALAYDTRDATLWMATSDARLVQFEPFGRRFLDEFSIGRAGSRIVPAAGGTSELYVLQGSEWVSVDPFSRAIDRVGLGVVREAIARDFDLSRRSELLQDLRFDAARAFLGRRGPARYEVTDVMPSNSPGRFWVATYGGFLEIYDSFSGAAEPVEYGLIGRGVAAVLAVEGDLWFAPLRPTDRYGVSRADEDLETWRVWGDGSIISDEPDAPDEPVHALVATGDGVWAGGDRLYRYDGEHWVREPLGNRAGDFPIRSLAEGPEGLEGVWVGTERGLYRIPSPGAGPEGPLANARDVRALAAVGPDLWVGTDFGIARVRSVDGLPQVVGTGAAPPGPVGALAAYAGRLYAGIGRDVWVFEGDAWTRAAPLGALAAHVTALAVRDGVAWIGSDEGVLVWDTREDVVTHLTFAAGDLPWDAREGRGVFGIAIEADGAGWVATPAGAIRFELDR